ncbi:MAG: hypothetical protein L0H19_06430, partial [Salinisphaera sp.]|nr:hypothetical protein [Salinisphaera sp.]
VSSVVVTVAPSTVMVEGTDYEVDAELGRVYLIPAGGINDGDSLELDYTPAAVSIEQITSSNLEAISGRFRFVAANTEGDNRDVVIPLATIRPNGDQALKSGPDRTTIMELSFELGIETLGTLAQIYMNGRPA